MLFLTFDLISMKHSELIFTAVKPPLDYLALIFAALVAYLIRYFGAVQSIRPVAFDLPFKQYFEFSVVIAIFWIIIFAISGLYSTRGTRSFKDELARVFVACSAGLALVLGIMVFSRYLFDSRFIIIATWVLAIIFVSIDRLIIQIVRRIGFKTGLGLRHLVVIGKSDIANQLVKEFKIRPSLGYQVIEHFEEFDSATKIKLTELTNSEAIDEILQVNPNINTRQTSNLIDFVNDKHLDFKYAADLLDTRLSNLEVVTMAGIPIVEVRRTKLDGWWRIFKRIFDIIGSIIFIITFSPIMLVTAIAIKLDSKGHVLFKYQRIGQYGKKFTYFKFRSMLHGSHELRQDPKFIAEQQNLRQGSPMKKFANDPRITRVGKFIRRFSIDELTELFLVLIGKMSLVGPRPHEIEEVEEYQKHHKKLLTIKPGITGLAQVSGRSDLDFEDEVKLDTYYIENWKIGLDIQILLKTPWAVLRRRKDT